MGRKVRRRDAGRRRARGKRDGGSEARRRGRRKVGSWIGLGLAGVTAVGLVFVGSRLWTDGGSQGESLPEAGARRFEVRVLRSHPHDPTAYTQGLLWHEGSMWESTGRYGESTVRRWDLRTGRIQQNVALPAHLFGEGLALAQDRLIQLTWKNRTALVYRPDTLEVESRIRYRGVGWGLTFDGQHLVMSDGSEVLTYRDPETFEPLRRLEVRQDGEAVKNLNELEWAEGWIFANVWTTDRIVRIDPQSGEVTGVIDASGLLRPEEQLQAEVLNGIAYKPQSETFLLTGKFWPRVFEAVFVPAD